MITQHLQSGTINPLPPEIIGTADLWPQAAQEQLAKFILEVCKLQPRLARTAPLRTSKKKAHNNNIPSLKETYPMKKRTKSRIASYPLPPELLGSVDPWPAAIQEQLVSFVLVKRKRTYRYEPNNLFDAFLMSGLTVGN
ncbi:hypothetical protein Geob_0715 [Geotalea daltonii FRC-32]|uniref:Uncharacterized protein n=1 Tax=Geotalea daltonii (strain DSM 22248 / JCM 15807 / FRC-32) TaxID=316067 RepID=B9M109_GEODF|nr:hypothetical protein [Geotalea daltonii]ACM19079.1 hypothetical protein Geob_0715 [Geotalea daltonii FRC-32]